MVRGNSEILVDKDFNCKKRLPICNRKVMKQKLQECTNGTRYTCESKNHEPGVFG